MNDHPLLQAYEDLALVTRQMVSAARAHDWQRLAALGRECSTRFQALLTVEDSRARGSTFQRRKADLIRRVLDDDAEIRVIVEPWLGRLGALISNTHSRSKLNAAYRAND